MRLVCHVWGDERTAGVRSGLGVQQGLAGGVEVVAEFLLEGLVAGPGGVALPALAEGWMCLVGVSCGGGGAGSPACCGFIPACMFCSRTPNRIPQ